MRRHLQSLPGGGSVAAINRLHSPAQLLLHPLQHRLLRGEVGLLHVAARIQSAKAHPNILPWVDLVGVIPDAGVRVDQKCVSPAQLIALVPALINPLSAHHAVEQKMGPYPRTPAAARGTLLTARILDIERCRAAFQLHGMFVETACGFFHDDIPPPLSLPARADGQREAVRGASRDFIIHETMQACPHLRCFFPAKTRNRLFYLTISHSFVKFATKRLFLIPQNQNISQLSLS